MRNETVKSTVVQQKSFLQWHYLYINATSDARNINTWSRPTPIFQWLLRMDRLTCNQSLLQSRSVQANNLLSCWSNFLVERKTGNIHRSIMEFDFITSRFNAQLLSSAPPALKVRLVLMFIHCLWCEFGLFSTGSPITKILTAARSSRPYPNIAVPNWL
jgi:hypothetical protein